MAEKQQEIRQRNLLIVIVILLFIGSIGAYIFRNRYLLRKQQVKELELENASRKLDHARTQLSNFTRRIKQNNKLINRLQNNKKRFPENHDLLKQIKTSSLLTDSDWITFKQLFDEVHPGYMERLKKTYPSLTPAEIRFMVLAKLQFTRKEMAYVLGISPKSLRVTWYRIRKKLDLSKDIKPAELAGRV